MTVIININGPINSGKSTVSKLLNRQFKNSVFIEVDDLMSDEEQSALGLSLRAGWAERLNRLDKEIIKLKASDCDFIIFAYPMDDANYKRWRKFADLNTVFLSITLAPSLEVCLQNRGQRELTAWEKSRIAQMYTENYQAPQHSDLIICNDAQTPEETVDIITDFLKKVLNTCEIY